VQLEAISGPRDFVTGYRRDPLGRRHRRGGALQRISDWWQGRRTRAQRRQAIRNFCEADDRLLRDIGVDRLVLRYGLTAVRPNGFTHQVLSKCRGAAAERPRLYGRAAEESGND
jgi:hypothetical protein